MNRRRFLAVGGTTATVSIAGCTADETQSEPADSEPDDSDGDTPEPDEQDDEQGDTERDDEPAVLEILDVDAPASVEQGEAVAVDVTLETSSPAAVYATLEADGDVLTETEARVDDGDSVTATLEVSVADDAPVGETTLEIEADNDDEVRSAVVAIDVTDALSTDERVMEENIDAALEYIEEAMAVYGDAAEYDGDDASFLHVLPSMEIDHRAADLELDDASDHARSALNRTDTDDEWDRVRNVRFNVELLEDLLFCQYGIHAAYLGIEESWELWEGDRSELDHDYEDFETAADRYDEIEDDIGRLGIEILNDDLEAKVEQVEWQIELLETTWDGVQNMSRATEPSFDTIDQVRLAREDFADAMQQLETDAAAPPETTTDDAFLEVVDDWYDEADEQYRDLVEE